MTDYKIVVSYCAEEMELEIKRLCWVGWIPAGGLTINPNTAAMYQALYKPQ